MGVVRTDQEVGHIRGVEEGGEVHRGSKTNRKNAKNYMTSTHMWRWWI